MQMQRPPRIERDGLAVRSPDPSDGRAVLVQVTPAGAKVVGSRRKERIGRLAALAGQLDPHHRQVLAASLPALLEMARFAAQPPNRPTAPLPSPTN
jgi:DNA-binding MarR family transcriptional regulator